MGDSVLYGLLDIIRGMTTIASVLMVGKTVGMGLEELFKIECKYCIGTGKVVCVKCRGTNTLCRRPAQTTPNLKVINRRYEDVYGCFVCGPTTPYENLGLLGEDEDINEMERIKESIRYSLRGKPYSRKNPLAGTMLCPECRGQRFIWYFMPNLPLISGLEEAWFMKTPLPINSAHTHNSYKEWPSRPLRPISEREIGYFGDDAFDYDDQAAELSWDFIEKDFDEKRSTASAEGAQTEPNDLEDFSFTTLQDISDISR